jgi:hypothetical protein
MEAADAIEDLAGCLGPRKRPRVFVLHRALKLDDEVSVKCTVQRG